MRTGPVGRAAPRHSGARDAHSASGAVSVDELSQLTLDPLRPGHSVTDTKAGTSSVVLARALAAGEFVAHLQPQVDLSTGRVIGVEALARWQRPGQGLVAPVSFLAAVEASGLMSSLTDVVLDDALRWWADRRFAGEEPIGVAAEPAVPPRPP